MESMPTKLSTTIVMSNIQELGLCLDTHVHHVVHMRGYFVEPIYVKIYLDIFFFE